MTNNDELVLKLKAAAEKATQGPWLAVDDDWTEGENAKISTESRMDENILPIAMVEYGGGCCEDEGQFYGEQEANAHFIALANPSSLRALLAERDADKKRIAYMQEQLARYSMSPGEADQRRCESRAVRDALGFGKDADNVAPVDLLEQISALNLRIAELQTVSTAAEKLVRCKGRYHSEQNYRALAALFGVKTPDLPPLETEARTVSVKLPENIPCPGAPQTIWLQTNGDDSNESSWPENSNDVSWCWEKMFHNDTLYVRADLAAGIKLEVGK